MPTQHKRFLEWKRREQGKTTFIPGYSKKPSHYTKVSFITSETLSYFKSFINLEKQVLPYILPFLMVLGPANQ